MALPASQPPGPREASRRGRPGPADSRWPRRPVAEADLARHHAPGQGTGNRHVARARQALACQDLLLPAPAGQPLRHRPELAGSTASYRSDRRGRPACSAPKPGRGRPGERRAGDPGPPQLPTVAEPDHGRARRAAAMHSDQAWVASCSPSLRMSMTATFSVALWGREEPRRAGAGRGWWWTGWRGGGQSVAAAASSLMAARAEDSSTMVLPVAHAARSAVTASRLMARGRPRGARGGVGCTRWLRLG